MAAFAVVFSAQYLLEEFMEIIHQRSSARSVGVACSTPNLDKVSSRSLAAIQFHIRTNNVVHGCGAGLFSVAITQEYAQSWVHRVASCFQLY